MIFLVDTAQALLIGLAILLVIFVIVIISNIKIVPQTKAYVVERLGRHHKTWGTGIHMLVPFIDRIAIDSSAPATPISKLDTPRQIGIVSLKEQILDFDPQPVITKDNVTMQIDTVIYFQVTDPKAYVYGVSKPLRALDNLTATTIRNIMGDLDLDEALTSREIVNTKMRAILDEATDPWGIKVLRVEVKNIMPPKDIREAMEKQMRAERERREKILQAEGEKKSSILIAKYPDELYFKAKDVANILRYDYSNMLNLISNHDKAYYDDIVDDPNNITKFTMINDFALMKAIKNAKHYKQVYIF